MNNYDWNDEDESPEQVSEALRKVRQESRHRKVRRQSMFGGMAIILLVGVFVGGMQISPDGNDDGSDVISLAAQNEAPAPADTVPGQATTPLQSTTTVGNPTASRPSVLYAAKNSNDGKGKIVAIDSRSGKELRTLVSGSTMNDLALSPDGKTLFFVENDASRVPKDLEEFDLAPSLKSVSTSGGAAVFHVYNAHQPRVSPDGTRVAYNSLGLSDVSGDAAILDLASNSTKLLTKYFDGSNRSDESGWVSGIVGWVDNSHVGTMLRVFPQAAKPGVAAIAPKRYYRVLDVDQVVDHNQIYRSADKGNAFSFPKASEDTTYDGVLLHNGRLLVVENNGPYVAARMLMIDAKTGNVTQTVATGYVGRAYGNPAADTSGDHLIYMSANDVRVVDFGGAPVVLTTGVVSAVW